MTRSELPSRSAVPAIEQILAGLMAVAVVAMLSLPAARGTSAALGWLPLWLLGLPAMALATSVLLRLSRGRADATLPIRAHRRRASALQAPVPRRGAGSTVRQARRPKAA